MSAAKSRKKIQGATVQKARISNLILQSSFHCPFNSNYVKIMPLLSITTVTFPHSMFWTSADVIDDNLPKFVINLIKFTQNLFVDANLKFPAHLTLFFRFRVVSYQEDTNKNFQIGRTHFSSLFLCLLLFLCSNIIMFIKTMEYIVI